MSAASLTFSTDRRPVALTLARSTRTVNILAVSLFLLSLPWQWLNQSRPIFSTPSKERYSIVTTPRERLYFSKRPSLYGRYETLNEKILASNCKLFGITLEQDEWEYPIWQLARRSGHPIDLIHVEVRWRKLQNHSRPRLTERDVCGVIYVGPSKDPFRPRHPNLQGLKSIWREDPVRFFLRTGAGSSS